MREFLNKNFNKVVGFWRGNKADTAVAAPLSTLLDIIEHDDVKRYTEQAYGLLFYDGYVKRYFSKERYDQVKSQSIVVQPGLLYDGIDKRRKSGKIFTQDELKACASGIMMLEVDNVDPWAVEDMKRFFISHPYCFFAAKSISGMGVYAFIEYDTKNDYKGTFTALQQELDEDLMLSFGTRIDKQTKQAYVGLRYLGYDPKWLSREVNEVYTKCVLEKDEKIERRINRIEKGYGDSTRTYYRWDRTPCTFRHFDHTERLRLFASVNAMCNHEEAKVISMWETLMLDMAPGKHALQHYLDEPVKGHWHDSFCFIDGALLKEAGFTRKSNVVYGIPPDFTEFLKRK